MIQVARRRPRHAAMKNLPHRWTTMAKKKTSTLHRCSELTNSPTVDTCHQVGPEDGQHHAGEDHHDEGGEGEDAEDVDPRRHIGGLAVGQQALGRQRLDRGVTQLCGPLVGVLGQVGDSVRRRSDRRRGAGSTVIGRRLPWRRNGMRMAATKTTTISPMRTRLATEIWMKPQWT